MPMPCERSANRSMSSPMSSRTCRRPRSTCWYRWRRYVRGETHWLPARTGWWRKGFCDGLVWRLRHSLKSIRSPTCKTPSKIWARRRSLRPDALATTAKVKSDSSTLKTARLLAPLTRWPERQRYWKASSISILRSRSSLPGQLTATWRPLTRATTCTLTASYARPRCPPMLRRRFHSPPLTPQPPFSKPSTTWACSALSSLWLAIRLL